MMNIQNLGLQESVRVKFKEGICVELCLKLWFERDWYFCDITKSGCLKVTVQKESPKQFRSSGMQMFLKIGNIHNI